jgi:hypothetical protein
MRDELKLFIFSVAVFALAYGVSVIFPIPVAVLGTLSVFFTLFTLVFNQRLSKAFHDPNKNKFTQVFLGFTMLKMLLSLVMLICFFYFIKTNHLNIGVCTMGFYLAYTAFEVLIWRKRLSS